MFNKTVKWPDSDSTGDHRGGSVAPLCCKASALGPRSRRHRSISAEVADIFGPSCLLGLFGLTHHVMWAAAAAGIIIGRRS